jgi:hypothetical protein
MRRLYQLRYSTVLKRRRFDRRRVGKAGEKKGGTMAPKNPAEIRKCLTYFFFFPPFFEDFLAAFFFVAIDSPPSRQLIDSLRARC